VASRALNAGSPAASDHPRPKLDANAKGTTFRLEVGNTDLAKYAGKEVEIHATVAQADQRVSGTTGTVEPPRNAKEVTSEGWPLAHVKDVHSRGDCPK
jgi:hypothetical protein